MKVTITHMKAPWPEGAGVGDTVELQGDTLPGWALGKCVPAADDAEVFAPATGEVMTPVEGDTLTTEPATAEGEAVEAQPQAAADAPAEAVTAAAPAPAPAVRRARAQPQAAA